MIRTKRQAARKATCSIFREVAMKLSAPKQITFWIAVVIAVLGVVLKLVSVPALSGYPGWLLLIAFVLLALGNLIKDL
jgi:threonine/homoserine/homoserine lactone efflux protein